ncbi:Small RNA degrading nuclease 2 [Platanthera guangdongensis]|uniref:Small RNA degrading nuclease 2 n=1 Tax=Platanthera guangdongensis TaxID=2320717 RepID=A0ABR2LBP7_9ASPA
MLAPWTIDGQPVGSVHILVVISLHGKVRNKPCVCPSWALLGADSKRDSYLHLVTRDLLHIHIRRLLPARGSRLQPTIHIPLLPPLIPMNRGDSSLDAGAYDLFIVLGKGFESDTNNSIFLKVNTWGNVVYDEYVRPLDYVVDFRTKISGIRPNNLKKAKEFMTVQKKVAELIKGRILVGHALHNDLKVLLLSHPRKDIRDTSEYQPLFRCSVEFNPSGKDERGLLEILAAEILDVKIQQKEHCSIKNECALMCPSSDKRLQVQEEKRKKELRRQKFQRPLRARS